MHTVANEYFRAQRALSRICHAVVVTLAPSQARMTKMSATVIDHSCALNSIKIPGKLGKFQFRDILSHSGCQRTSSHRARASPLFADIIKRSVVVAYDT